MCKIKDLTGAEIEIDDCLGCEINDGKLVPFGGVLYQSKQFTVTQDFELPIDGFIIISTARHVERFTDLTQEEQGELVVLINKVLNILRKANVSKEFNVILEEKEGCHFHVWLMPRHDWMIEKFGKVIKKIQDIQEYAFENLRTEENFEKIMQTCKLIRDKLSK